MKLKKCRVCNIEKPLDQFYRTSSVKCGRQSKCKICKNIVCKISYNKRPRLSPNPSLKEKQCSDCKQIKNINQFNIRPDSKDGYRGRCKSCDYACNKKYAKSHHEKILNMNRRLKGTLNSKFKNWKRGAEDRGIDFNLTIDDISNIPLICSYTNRPLTWETGKSNTVSMDRINSSLGYVKNNVVFCMKDVNYMKSYLNIENFLSLCEDIARNKNKILSLDRNSQKE